MLSSAQAAGVPATVNVAVVPNYPPFEFKDPATSDLRGVDIDLGDALAKRMGVKIAWQETSFDTMMSALQTARVDMILSGMTDVPARRDTADFVDYIKTGPQFYTLKANSASLPSMASLCGKRVGSSRRTTFPANIQAWSSAHCEAAGKPAITVVGTDGSADARLQLKQGRLDAGVQGGETLPYQNSIENNAYVGIGKPFLDQYTGIAVLKTNTALRDALVKAFTSMVADGSYKAILAKWGLQEHALDKVVINSQD
ncbi:ABC transporter substrate-binding protein [Robbsia sp. KACC 23696]|uniref:ABC transporter substrate-binding protein n=1 Tax=Robbsia sp. KACC 23696 TaxID=3149231 RepID=UPI00325A5CAB